MNKFSLILSLALGLTATSAMAAEYARWGVVCRVAGTQQTFESTKQRLPYTATLRLDMASTVGQRGAPIYTKVSLESSKNHDFRALSAALKPSASLYFEDCYQSFPAHITVDLGSVSANQFRELLLNLGAKNVPDMNEAAKDGAIALGTWEFGQDKNYCGHKELPEDGREIQVHFPPEKYLGLSYHLVFEKCRAIHIDKNGKTTRTGD